MFGIGEVRKQLRMEELRRQGFEQGLAPNGPEPIGGYGFDAQEREVFREARERGERARRLLRDGRA